jgi:hypothetical protein
MPMFGGKKFPYTPAGKKAAKAYAAGEKMEMKKGMKKKTVKKSAKKAMPKKMGKKK